MTKQMLGKMLAGLSLEEQKAALTDMGITTEAAQAEYLTLAASANAAPITQPVVTVPPAAPATVPATQPVATQQQAVVAPGADVQTIMAQLATEKNARIAAECSAFMALNANKITPAEQTAVQNLFVTLAAGADPAALAAYKASIEARPVNHMLQETVSSAAAVVLNNNTHAVDTRTEAEKEAATISAFLNLTDVGQQSVQAMKAGKVNIITNDGKIERPVNMANAFKQFAIAAPEGV